MYLRLRAQGQELQVRQQTVSDGLSEYTDHAPKHKALHMESIELCVTHPPATDSKSVQMLSTQGRRGSEQNEGLPETLPLQTKEVIEAESNIWQQAEGKRTEQGLQSCRGART